MLQTKPYLCPSIKKSISLIPLLLTASLIAHAQIQHQATLPSGMTWCSDSMINGLASTINTYRSQNGASPLQIASLGMKDADLRAIQFAQYMTTNPPGTPGFNPHTGWDTTASSIGYNIISENLAYMTSDPNYIVYAAWNDSLHIAALLASDATVMGVSCVYYNGTPYWSYEPAKNGTPLGGGGGGGGGGSPQPLDNEELSFLTLINNYRAQNGAPALVVSTTLQNASQWMSNDMATNNNASHTDSLGRSVGTRLAAFGYNYFPYGENISGGSADAQSAFTGFQNACDPDATGACTYAHRKNMLNASFLAIGIKRVYNANSTYGWYWTTDFGGVVDQVFYAPPPPPPPSTPSITSFTATPTQINAGQSSTLSWVVSNATSVTIDNGVGNVTNSTMVSVSPAATTTYKLTASNGGASVSAQVTITVNPNNQPPDTQPPSAPVLTKASASGPTQVDLAWLASTDNVGVTGYRILRNGAILTAVGGSTLTYSDTNAAANTLYTYTVTAFDAAGNVSQPSNAIQLTTPPVPVSSCPAPITNGYTGCYYPNRTLTGGPVLSRNDSQVRFNWLSAPAGPSLPANNFSARWQGNFTFQSGLTTFTIIANDGVRLYLDGVKIFDRWNDAPSAFIYPKAQTTAGTHLVTLEYYSNSSSATTYLWWNTDTTVQPSTPIINSFTAAPANITAGQSTTLSWNVSNATSLTLDNGIGAVTGLNSKIVSPNANTTYVLTASNATGSVTAQVTVLVSAPPPPDTQPPSIPVLTSASAKSPTEVDLAWTASTDNVGVAGYRILRNGAVLTTVGASTLTWPDTTVAPNTIYTYSIVAFDAAGNSSNPSNSIQLTTPQAQVSACPAPADNAYTACYFANRTLSGTPALARTDSQLRFNWQAQPPTPSLPPNNFSALWQGNMTFQSGLTSFTVVANDGVRLYIDGVKVVDRWMDAPAAFIYAKVQTTAGPHLVRLEYYSNSSYSPMTYLWWNTDTTVH